MRQIYSLALAITLLLSCAGASRSADGINISPVRLFFEDDKSKTVTVTNTTQEPYFFQIESFEWSQGEGARDRYEKTGEVMVLPLTLTLDPGEKKQLRIGLKDATRREKERTYRMFVRQLPMKKPGEAQVKVVVQQGLPIFVPPKEPKEAVSIDKISLSEGKTLIEIKNSGNKHFLPTALEANGLDDSGNSIFTVAIDSWYTLPGMSKTFAFELPAEGCEKLASVEVMVRGAEAGEMKKSIKADKEACVAPLKEKEEKSQPGKLVK